MCIKSTFSVLNTSPQRPFTLEISFYLRVNSNLLKFSMWAKWSERSYCDLFESSQSIKRSADFSKMPIRCQHFIETDIHFIISCLAAINMRLKSYNVKRAWIAYRKLNRVKLIDYGRRNSKSNIKRGKKERINKRIDKQYVAHWSDS